MEHSSARPPIKPLDEDIQRLISCVARFGDKYVEEFLFPHLAKPLKVGRDDHAAVLEALRQPTGALRALYGHYAFARRGKGRQELVESALAVLDLISAKDGLATPGDDVWAVFETELRSRGMRASETQDRGIVQGLFELAVEVESEGPGESIVTWIERTVHETGAVEGLFNRIVDIRGLGPKTTSTFIRDVVFIYGHEQELEAAEKIHIQPVDRWLRLMAHEAVPESGMREAADWVIAGKVSKYCRRAGVSSILFSMGCTHFGQRVVREVERFDYEIGKLKRSLG